MYARLTYMQIFVILLLFFPLIFSHSECSGSCISFEHFYLLKSFFNFFFFFKGENHVIKNWKDQKSLFQRCCMSIQKANSFQRATCRKAWGKCPQTSVFASLHSIFFSLQCTDLQKEIELNWTGLNFFLYAGTLQEHLFLRPNPDTNMLP